MMSLKSLILRKFLKYYLIHYKLYQNSRYFARSSSIQIFIAQSPYLTQAPKPPGAAASPWVSKRAYAAPQCNGRT